MVRSQPAAPAFLVPGHRRTVLLDMAVVSPEVDEAAVDESQRRSYGAGTYIENGYLHASSSVRRLYVDDLPGGFPGYRSHRRFGHSRSWRLEAPPEVGTTPGAPSVRCHYPGADSQPEMRSRTWGFPDSLHEHVRA